MANSECQEGGVSSSIRPSSSADGRLPVCWEDGHNGAAPGTLPFGLRVALAGIIIVGLGLRLVYPGTTVFCEDQAHACALAQDVAGGHWQSGGLINSGGFRNLPGLVYLLAAVWRLWPDPLALVLFTGIVNVLAVLLSAYLMRRWVSSTAAWWATALLASAPWAIHYSRWIWAQHLLFPTALMVYLFLWQWLGRRRKWAALGVILSLTLLMQIHLIGVVLAIAVGLLLPWCRPKLPLWPVLIGVVIAVISVLPYLLDGQLDVPHGNRLGYQHAWRVVPAATMSVTGLGWQLEFRSGYSAFAQSLGWRRWPYEAVMGLVVLLLLAGVVMGLRRLWRLWREGPDRRRAPLAMVTALVLLIPLSFALLGLRTSPTYFPVWYPLPFVLMGYAAACLTDRTDRSRDPERREGHRRRRWVAPVMLAVICVQLLFFAEQLRYIHHHGGVPGSPLGRSYAGMKSDIADLTSRVDATNVWMLYDGPSSIQDEPAAYLLRQAEWAGERPGRVLIRFAWGGDAQDQPRTVQPLPDGMDPPPEAYLIRPWTQPHQRGSEIPLRPE